jgi:hypothetical protein
MDTFTNGTLGGASVTLIVLIIVGIYKAVNHKRCRSNCLGRQVEISMDIDTTTPPARRLNLSLIDGRPPSEPINPLSENGEELPP